MLASATAGAMLAAGMAGATLGAPAVAAPATTGGAAQDTAWLVLAEEGASAQAIAHQLTARGGTVGDVNSAIGLVAVRSGSADFASSARSVAGVKGVAKEQVIGSAPKRAEAPDSVERENLRSTTGGSRASGAQKAAPEADPLDAKLWGMEMINAVEAHRYELGDRRVTVGILDTGVQADHPDLAENVDIRKSRNFTTDIEAVDGACEEADCVDPATEDDNGHGTHVAGTIGAALNGRGLSGVAPEVTLVNIRGGQDSGYFFLAPVVNALTYAGDKGIDVVNMSFYVDPWLYNCLGGAPEDTQAQAEEQEVIIESMNRALRYAHRKDVTLVGALGNNHEDLSDPRVDSSSPDYPPDTAHDRTIDNETCWDLPVEGPHVLGVSALGPSGKKSDFSNYANDLNSGEIELSAPGGWFRDGFGTPTFRTNENMILSSVPLVSLQDTGEVDENGNITPLGESTGVIKECGPATKGATECGYYAYFQGTSMAAPHASGVAALAVSAHGTSDGERGLVMRPNRVKSLMMRTATDHACPPGGVQEYTDEGRDASFTATCTGTDEFNAFYGAGIVNALGVVR
jgi:subtilisin family serine protease